MAHQMAQEGALWPSVIRFGPHWHSNKINIVKAVLDVGTKNTIRLLILNMVKTVEKTKIHRLSNNLT